MNYLFKRYNIKIFKLIKYPAILYFFVSSSFILYSRIIIFEMDKICTLLMAIL